MYLLIQEKDEEKNSDISTFTFHNVSINSLTNDKKSGFGRTFTFHNVSINSEKREELILLSCIYIP